MGSPYVLTLLGAGALSVAFAAVAWRHRESPGATPLVVLALAAAFWQIGYAFELGASEYSSKLLAAKIEYPGIVTAPVAWLAVALQYSGRGRWLNRRNLALMAIMPLITASLAFTNELHHLIWTEITLDDTGAVSALVFEHGAWFWVYTAFGYLVMVFGIVFVADMIFHTHQPYRAQAAALLASALAPWVANWSFLAGFPPAAHVDMTPYGFIVSCGLLIWAVRRARLLDLAPTARRAALEGMSDGVLVLDAIDRVVDMNPAAKKLIGVSDDSAIGRPAAEVWADGVELLAEARAEETTTTPATVELDSEMLHIDVSISPLLDFRGSIAGRLVLLHDITPLVNSENERVARAEATARVEELQRSRQRLLTVSESLRKEVARHLHESVQSELIYVLHQLDEVTSESPPAAAGRLRDIRGRIEALIERDIRRFSVDIYPGILRRGLVPSLLSLADSFDQPITMDMDERLTAREKVEPDMIPEDVRLSAYRITSEALSHFLKNGDNGQPAIVGLRLGDGWLRLQVTGAASRPDGEQGGRADIMRDYAEAVGGQLLIRGDAPDQIEVAATLPLQEWRGSRT